MYKKTIILKPNVHRDKKVIQVIFSYDKEINAQLRKSGDIKYSATMKSWYYLESDFSLAEFFTTFTPIAFIDYSELKEEKPVSPVKNKPARKKAKPVLSELQQAAMDKSREHLILKNYSKSTVRTYLSMLLDFFCHHSDKEPLEITEEEIKDYLVYQLEERRISISTQNQVINAIKFYYEKVEKLERKTYYVERPMKPFKLPAVLSYREVQQLIHSTDNLKHKAVLSTIYAGGLRISELINLQITDIKSDHKRILVRGGKGRKDRLTLLSDKLLVILRDYMKEYRPQTWLFEGHIPGIQYSATSIREILRRAAKNAGIFRKVTPHTLRHSFATHMMEHGTDIRLIQDLLGHNSLKTTEIYTHISSDAINRLKSPFDYEE